MEKSLNLNNGCSLPAVGLGTFKSEINQEDIQKAVKYAIDLGYRHVDCAWFYGNEKEVGTAIREKISEGTIKREEIFVTSKSEGNEVRKAVELAIDIGYRHFDCAWFYGNEKEVGTAIREKIAEGKVEREDIFITSKLWNNFHSKEDVVPMITETLRLMKLDYIDLYLIHWPFGFKKDADYFPIGEGPKAYSDVDYLETWEGMEECVNLGLTKSIGVSNFNSEQIERLLGSCKIKPVCNQVEVNPNLNQKDLIKYCSSKDIVVVGYCPLGRSENSSLPGFPKPTIFDPKVAEIGKKYNKTPAQVVLNYLVSLGISVIPKSVTESRIKENFEIFDFTLSSDDIKYLDSCNKNQRVCPCTDFKDHPYYPFNIPF